MENQTPKSELANKLTTPIEPEEKRDSWIIRGMGDKAAFLRDFNRPGAGPFNHMNTETTSIGCEPHGPSRAFVIESGLRCADDPS